MKRAITRRHFLAAAATAAVAPALIPARALGRAGAPAASDRIAMAVIGLGSRGPSLIGPLLGFPEVQLVAVCDVHRNKAERVANPLFPRLRSGHRLFQRASSQKQ